MHSTNLFIYLLTYLSAKRIDNSSSIIVRPLSRITTMRGVHTAQGVWNAVTVSALSQASGREFHSGTVLTKKECLYWANRLVSELVCQRNVHAATRCNKLAQTDSCSGRPNHWRRMLEAMQQGRASKYEVTRVMSELMDVW